jgi:hypothetical protein
VGTLSTARGASLTEKEHYNSSYQRQILFRTSLNSVVGHRRKTFFYFKRRELPMGRRSKNKQGDPEPMKDRQIASPKKLGKRKLEHEDVVRPVKKVKESGGLRREKSSKKAVVGGVNKVKEKENVGKSKGKKTRNTSEEESDTQWEDVDDDVDLKAEVK